jgi:cysteine desulfurase
MGVPAEVAQTAVRFTFPHDLAASLEDVAAAVAAAVAAVRPG